MERHILSSSLPVGCDKGCHWLEEPDRPISQVVCIMWFRKQKKSMRVTERGGGGGHGYPSIDFPNNSF